MLVDTIYMGWKHIFIPSHTLWAPWHTAWHNACMVVDQALKQSKVGAGTRSFIPCTFGGLYQSTGALLRVPSCLA
jgi:hypothetical protein